MVIGDDGRRLGLGGRLGGGQVAPFTKQYVDHPAVLIDGAVEVPLDAATEEEDPVDIPAAAKPTTMAAGRGGEASSAGASGPDRAQSPPWRPDPRIRPTAA